MYICAAPFLFVVVVGVDFFFHLYFYFVCTVHSVIFMANIAFFFASLENLLAFLFTTERKNLGVRARIQLSILFFSVRCLAAVSFSHLCNT